MDKTEREAFRDFAEIHPLEAYEQNPGEFMKYMWFKGHPLSNVECIELLVSIYGLDEVKSTLNPKENK